MSSPSQARRAVPGPLVLLLAGALSATSPTLAMGAEGLPPVFSIEKHGPDTGSPQTSSKPLVAASGRQLDLRTGQTVTLLTTLPFPATETIFIKDTAGSVVRTLVAKPRAPGRYSDAWDGMGENGIRLNDGQYRWIAVFEGEGQTVTLDDSGQLDGDSEVKGHAEYGKWDPFDNSPLRISHRFDRPGEIVLVFSRKTLFVKPACDPPEFFCRRLDGYQPAGEFSYEWAGVDDSGAYRPDIHAVFAISQHQELSRNAIVVHGGRPVVGRVTVSPPVFRPDVGVQRLSFLVSSFWDEPVSIDVTWTNQESRSILKTIRFDRVQPGMREVAWNGKSDANIRVAPGGYTVAVRATDALSQTSLGQILTIVEY